MLLKIRQSFLWIPLELHKLSITVCLYTEEAIDDALGLSQALALSIEPRGISSQTPRADTTIDAVRRLPCQLLIITESWHLKLRVLVCEQRDIIP